VLFIPRLNCVSARQPERTAVDRVAEIENVLPSIRGTDHAEAHIVFHFGALLQLLEELVTRKSASVGARIGHVDCGARPIPQGPLGHYSIGLTTRCSAARNSSTPTVPNACYWGVPRLTRLLSAAGLGGCRLKGRRQSSEVLRIPAFTSLLPKMPALQRPVGSVPRLAARLQSSICTVGRRAQTSYPSVP
jgi:hypothetical protein